MQHRNLITSLAPHLTTLHLFHAGLQKRLGAMLTNLYSRYEPDQGEESAYSCAPGQDFDFGCGSHMCVMFRHCTAHPIKLASACAIEMLEATGGNIYAAFGR
jgi:hypothetical protein